MNDWRKPLLHYLNMSSSESIPPKENGENGRLTLLKSVLDRRRAVHGDSITFSVQAARCPLVLETSAVCFC